MIDYQEHHTEIDGQRSLQLVAIDVMTGARPRLMIVGGGTLVGVNTGTPTVYAMHVLPVWRGNGIGSRILRDLQAAAGRMVDPGRTTKLLTIVRHDNADAIRFYERHGFKPIARPPGKHGRILLQMSLN